MTRFQFSPFGPEDVQAAQQETDYVNYVFNQKNPGFMVLYSFIKDALLSKMGIVKVWTEVESRTEKETFYDQPDDQFALLAANKDLEIVAHSEHVTDYGTLHDVTVERIEGLQVPQDRGGAAGGIRHQPHRAQHQGRDLLLP